jgi:hypothetical protein
MAALPGFPEPIGLPCELTNVAPSLNNFALDESTDEVAALFQVPWGSAPTITRLGVRQATATGTPPTYKISLQGIASGGDRDGTIKGGGSPASKTFTPVAGGDGTFQWFTLDNAYVASPGELLALVVKYSSGTVSGAHNCSFTYSASGVGTYGLPRSRIAISGSFSGANSTIPIFGWGTAGLAYGFPLQNVGTVAINSGSATKELGFKFKLPAATVTSFGVGGVGIKATGAAATLRITLYGSDGTTVLHQHDIDMDVITATNGGASFPGFDDTTLSALLPNTTYSIGFAPQDANDVTFYYLDFAAAADLDARPGGQEWNYVTRGTAGSGAWTDTLTRRLVAGVLLGDLTTAAAGGVNRALLPSGVSALG